MVATPVVAALAPAVRTETRPLAGLAAPGRIVTDHWGVAHIDAASARDAFFLQGYTAARDRLWQIDLWRKRALGQLAASFGPAYVEQDRAARLFFYRGDMAAEWAAYPAGTRAETTAFVAGINAYVDEISAGRRPLPVEFGLTGSRPDRWQADDIVRIRSNALVANLGNEVARARSLCLGGGKWEPLRVKIEPPHTVQPAEIDPCSIPATILDDYNLGTGPVVFDGKTLVAAAGPRAEEGSNNWVIAPDHSETGRPILANDPHRAHGVPSLRSVVHLRAPGLDIIGAGEPALPGISFGHNNDIAWGLTIFPSDQEDLFVYARSGTDSYRSGARTLKFRTITETIAVKGGAMRQAVLRFTEAGPVIALDDKHAFALRSVWAEPGGSGYFNAAWLWRAHNWRDFEIAQSHWGAPPLNLVYADTAGNIGWHASGFVPVRQASDGLLPVPGDGRHDWQGLLDPRLLPSERNPARGWIASANQMNLPADYPNDTRRIGFEWTDRSRIDRIEAVLAAKPKLGLTDSMALQTDITSPLALRTTALLAGLAPADPDARAAAALLTGWNGEYGIDSAAAALFEVWTAHHLRAAAVAAAVPAAARPAFTGSQLAAVVGVLAAPGDLFGADPAAARAAILTTSLAAAWAETRQLLGADSTRWRWGDLHLARFAPASAAIAPAALRKQMVMAPLQVGGSGSTPMATSMRPGSFDVTAGASVRIVLDVGAWDNSVFINTPGQSGDPFSPHYRDLYALWAAGRYVPLAFTPAAVDGAAESVTEFTPAR